MHLPADATVADPVVRERRLAATRGDSSRPLAGASPSLGVGRAPRFAGLVFALPLLGLVAAGWWSLWGTRSLFVADMVRTIALLCDETQHTLETQQVMLAALNARVSRLGWDEIRARPDVLAFARDLVAASHTVETFGLTAPDGHIALATEADQPPTSVDLSDRDFVTAFPVGTARRQSFISVPVFSRVDGRPQVHLSRPRITVSGEADGGTVVAGFDPAVFERVFAAVAASPHTGFMLLRSDGAVLARYPVPVTAAGLHSLPPDHPVLAALDNMPADQSRVIETGSLLRGLHLTAVERLAGWPLVLVEQGDPQLFWRRWLSMMAFPALGAAAAMLLLGVLMVRLRRTAAIEAARLGELAAAAKAAHAALVERSALEGRLREVEKTAALGQLAAGVAHDFNNLLQAMLMGTEGLQRQAHNPAEVRDSAAMLLKVVERGAALTRRMLDFARRDDATESFAVAEALRAAADLLNRSFAGQHAVRLALPGGALPRLRGSEAEFETVIINLAVNARDAMPEGGEIVVGADLAGTPPASAGGTVPTGPWLRLQVSDTGLGMDAETLARAGEAFFTTKPPGKGTGLGLAMARGYAQRAGGTLEIASTPGEGTVVTLRLPVG